MEAVNPKISVEYAGEATIVTFIEEKILEEREIQALEKSIMAVIEQSEGLNLILNFSNVKFLSSTVLGLLIKLRKSKL